MEDTKEVGECLRNSELIAPVGMYRVIKESFSPEWNIFVGDFSDKEIATKVIMDEKGVMSNYYNLCIYDDKGVKVFEKIKIN